MVVARMGLVVGLACLLAGPSVHAQTVSAPTVDAAPTVGLVDVGGVPQVDVGLRPRDLATFQLARNMTGDPSVSHLLTFYSELFDNADLTGDGFVSADDVLLRNQIVAAKKRAEALALWAEHDMNGDGAVTREDLSALFLQDVEREVAALAAPNMPDPGEIADRLARRIELAMPQFADPDGNGRSTLGELFADLRARYPSTPEGVANLEQPLVRPLAVRAAFDRDGNGAVSRTEFLGEMTLAIAIYDSNEDGVFSNQEVAVLRGDAAPLLALVNSAPDWSLADTRPAVALAVQPGAPVPDPVAQPASSTLVLAEGNAQANTIDGNDTADRLTGAAGNDVLRGRAGRDIYVFRPGDGNDLIVDTSPEGSILVFDASIDLGQITLERIGEPGSPQDLRISYGPGDAVVIKDWAALSEETRNAWTLEYLGG